MRVVVGILGGRRIAVSSGDGTRPTSDRVCEALFSMLGDVGDVCVLDLFVGFGALVIEVLSRGVAQALLVEKDGRAARVIEANLAALELGEDRVRLLCALAETALRTACERGDVYDLVFLDLPYRLVAGLGPRLADAFVLVLALGACVVCESDHRAPLDLSGLRTIHDCRYGDTLICIHEA